MHVITPKIAVIGAGDSTLTHATFSAYSFAHPNKVAIDLLLDKTDGLPPEFKTVTLKRAIFATGWDGNIAVTARTDGSLSVETGF